jgi:hypothetical protein
VNLKLQSESESSWLYFTIDSETGISLTLKIVNFSKPPPEKIDRSKKKKEKTFNDGEGSFFEKAREEMYAKERKMKSNRIVETNVASSKYWS